MTNFHSGDDRGRTNLLPPLLFDLGSRKARKAERRAEKKGLSEEEKSNAAAAFATLPPILSLSFPILSFFLPLCAERADGQGKGGEGWGEDIE